MNNHNKQGRIVLEFPNLDAATTAGHTTNPHWVTEPEGQYIVLFSLAELDLRKRGHDKVADATHELCTLLVNIIEKKN